MSKDTFQGYPAKPCQPTGWFISSKAASALAKAHSIIKRLPKPGYETTLVINHQTYFLCRSIDKGKLVWWIREAIQSLDYYGSFQHA